MSKNFTDLIRRYTIRYEKKIKRICAPLKECLYIPTFAYYTVESDGRFAIFSNNPGQLDFFYSEKLYLSCPYLTHPSLFRSGSALIPLTADPQYLELSRRRYSVNHLFLNLQQRDEKLEGFFFIQDDLKPETGVPFLNHLDLLARFGAYFKREASALITAALEEGYNLRQAKGEAFFYRDPKLPLSCRDERVTKFCKQISPLTSQEKKCLNLFQQGNSAQASAAILGLSQRTVEHYFESIKSKLNCKSKWDLLGS
jgi:DNA-binding CsgD family transcriptional regulator